MSKLLARLAGIFSSRTFVGADKTGNRYFTRTEEIDGIMKEKRWVIFKVDQDPTSIPVEWICWLNGQRKKAPTTEEMMELELRRERVRLNVELLKKEEEERKAKIGVTPKVLSSSGKVGGPDLKTFIRQFPTDSEVIAGVTKESAERADETEVKEEEKTEAGSSEPTGTGASFRPGTWQPPS